MSIFTTYYFVPNTVQDGYVVSESGTINRIYAQYRNKPKVVAWYGITRQLADEIATTCLQIRNTYNIYTAAGAELDVIGKIVVVPRNFLGYVPLNPGMFAEPDGDEFGDESAMFSALSIDQDSQMSDELYRLAIRSKIVKNNSAATIDDILFSMNFLLPDANVLRVTDNEDMSFSVEFYGNITELQRWALLNANLVPKPQGVKFNGFLEARDYVQSGDISKQFGDTTAQFVGFVGV